jgi:hypothetical protein
MATSHPVPAGFDGVIPLLLARTPLTGAPEAEDDEADLAEAPEAAADTAADTAPAAPDSNAVTRDVEAAVATSNTAQSSLVKQIINISFEFKCTFICFFPHVLRLCAIHVR